MAIEKRVGKHGIRYVVRVDLGRDPVTGKRRQRKQTCRTSREAHRREAEWQAAIDRGSVVDAARYTVAAYLEHWLSTKARHEVRPSTYAHYRRWARLHVVPALGVRPLDRLGAEHIQALVSSLIDGPRQDGKPGGYARKTIRCVYGLLHHALADAVTWRLVPHNVADQVKPPRLEHKEMAVWSADQVFTFLHAARESAYLPAWLLTVCTGMRRGEVLGLRWVDLRAEGHLLTIRASLSRQTGLQLGATKSGKARTVRLPVVCLEALAQHATVQKRWRVAAGPAWQDSGHIFTTRAGRPIDPEQLVRAFHVIRVRAELPHIRFHDLRHTHASLLLRAGTHMKVVSERLGHSTIQMTMDNYAHLAEDMQQHAADAMDSILDFGHILGTNGAQTDPTTPV